MSDKIKVLESLIDKVDILVVGGGMANTFLLAQGKSVGKSLAEHDRVEDARRILAAAEARNVPVILPTDVVIAKEVTRGTEYKTVGTEKFPASWHIVDIGEQTRTAMEEALAPAKTVFWNGPLGVFEIPSFAHGTKAVARYLAGRADEGVTVVVGGGDSVAALEQQGLATKMTHISTGGGASLEFLEGRELPGIAVLQDRPADGQAARSRRRRWRPTREPVDEHDDRAGRRPRDPRLARQPDGRGRRRPRRRVGRAGGGAVRRLDRRPRGGRAARRRQEPLRRQGRADAPSPT